MVGDVTKESTPHLLHQRVQGSVGVCVHRDTVFDASAPRCTRIEAMHPPKSTPESLAVREVVDALLDIFTHDHALAAPVTGKSH